MSVEITSEEKIESIEKPWDDLNDCHHEEEGLKKVID